MQKGREEALKHNVQCLKSSVQFTGSSIQFERIVRLGKIQ